MIAATFIVVGKGILGNDVIKRCSSYNEAIGYAKDIAGAVDIFRLVATTSVSIEEVEA